MFLLTLLCYILSAWCASVIVERILRNSKITSPLSHRRMVDVIGDYGEESPGQSDEIYPVHFIDQAAIVRSSVISYSFRYEHVLDPQRLRESLSALLSSGDWRKLAGRLRQNVSEMPFQMYDVIQTSKLHAKRNNYIIHI